MSRWWGQKEMLRQLRKRLVIKPFGFEGIIDESLQKYWSNLEKFSLDAPYEIILKDACFRMQEVATAWVSRGYGPKVGPCAVISSWVQWKVPSRENAGKLVTVMSYSAEELARHEVLENLYVDGVRVFDPHV